MLLSKLLNSIAAIQVIGNPETIEVKSITLDSREVRNGAIFVAIRGLKTDGRKFISQAVSNGASAIILDNNDDSLDRLLTINNVVKILVDNSRKTLAILADAFYQSPSQKLNLIGITGTKGKTTTSYYIKNIFDQVEIKSGLIGTNTNIIDKIELPSKLTTPEAHVINNLIDQMVKADCSQCVMEVSSHALELSRVDALDFNVGIFTNITSDHLDFHSNFEHYLSAKKIFFDNLNSNAKIIFNKDDLNYSKLLSDSAAEKISFSVNQNSDIRVENVEYDLDGTKFQINYLSKVYDVETKLIGLFNAYNATAAFGAVVYSGVNVEEAISGIYSTPQVPGRFEVISSKNKKVIIDYSHTADSLDQSLKAIRHIVNNSRPVYTVFGCGGDRDKTKRPIMGKIAESSSDFIYVTSDNPRTEDSYEIINQITNGLDRENHKVIEDREDAIKSAITDSEDDAVILIAGKGHENYQEINEVRHFFSDKEVAEKYL